MDTGRAQELEESVLKQKERCLQGITKTGTTIVGVRGSKYVVLAADTRSTSGPTVMNKNCHKIHRISDGIMCCGAGTAADTYFTCKMAECAIYKHSLKYEKIPSVRHCTNILKRHLFSYRGYVQASLILGGVDEDGVHLCGIHPHGSIDDTLPYTAQGSGSYAAIGVLETEFREDMTVDEAVDLATKAVEAGIRNDLFSGSNVDICVIEQKEGTPPFTTMHKRSHKTIGSKPPGTAVYKYPKESIKILKEVIIEEM